MTLPTITYGIGWQSDCPDTTGWTNDGGAGDNIGAPAFAAEIGDVLKLGGTCSLSTDEYIYRLYDLTNFSSTTFNNFAIKWKTYDSSNSLGARAKVRYTVGTEWILGETVPQFDLDWHITTGTLTTGKTVDKLELWADDYPDTVDSAVSVVYFDWIMFYTGTFSFPDFKVFPLGLDKKIARLEIPGRDGDVIQDLGMKSPELVLRGNMQSGESWGTPLGEYMYYMLRETGKWQWFTSDMVNCQVVPTYFGPSQDVSSGQQRLWELRLLLHKLSSLGETHWDGKAWFGKQ